MPTTLISNNLDQVRSRTKDWKANWLNKSLEGRTTKGPKQDSQNWLRSPMHDGDEP